MGCVKVPLAGMDVEFHVVPDHFPIEQDGILGTNFFELSSGAIDYSKGCIVLKDISVPFETGETVIIPARSRKQIHVRISNPELKTGYIPLLDAGKDLYIGNAVVTNRNGIAYIYAVNTSTEEIELAVPTVTLQSYDESQNISDGGSTPDDQKKLKRTHQPPTRRRITESDGSGNPSPKKQPRIQELSSYQDTEDPAENSPALSRVVVWSDSEESYYYDTDQSNTVRRVKKRGHGSTSSSDRPIKKRLRKRSERNRKIESEKVEVTKPAEQVSSSSSSVPEDLSVQPEEHAMTHPPSPPRDSSV
ncbi:hypothetical protein KM043_016118, partial [Ampulex compressa]